MFVPGAGAQLLATRAVRVELEGLVVVRVAQRELGARHSERLAPHAARAAPLRLLVRLRGGLLLLLQRLGAAVTRLLVRLLVSGSGTCDKRASRLQQQTHAEIVFVSNTVLQNMIYILK